MGEEVPLDRLWSDDSYPQFDWLFFYVEHVKKGVCRLNNQYFPCAGILWPKDDVDFATVALPMENSAVLALGVYKEHASIHVSHQGASCDVVRGCLVPVASDEHYWSESVTTTGDVAGYMRQLGRMGFA